MTYSLKTGAGGTIFTNGIGIIRSENTTKDAQLFQQAIPFEDSDSTIVLDLFGTNKNITIDGTFTSNTPANIVTFVGQIEGLANGRQTPYQWYSDVKGSTIYVVVTSASWKTEEGSPTKVDYTINMMEAKS